MSFAILTLWVLALIFAITGLFSKSLVALAGTALCTVGVFYLRYKKKRMEEMKHEV